MYVRWMIRQDVPSCLSLNRGGQQEENIIGEMRNRNTVGMVVERNNEVCGYMIYDLHKYRIIVTSMYWSNNRAFDCMMNKLIDKTSAYRRRLFHVDINLIKQNVYILSQLSKTPGFIARLVFDNKVRFTYSTPKHTTPRLLLTHV